MSAATTNHRKVEKVDHVENVAANENTGHTILLLQFTADQNTRTFIDYDSIKVCVEGLCYLFEQKLKTQFPELQEITYDVQKMFDYLDSLEDLACMIYNVNIKAYEPKSRDWIKEQVYRGLKQQS